MLRNFFPSQLPPLEPGDKVYCLAPLGSYGAPVAAIVVGTTQRTASITLLVWQIKGYSWQAGGAWRRIRTTVARTQIIPRVDSVAMLDDAALPESEAANG